MATLYLWHYLGILRVLPSCRVRESGGHWHYFYLLPLEYSCVGGVNGGLWGCETLCSLVKNSLTLSWVGAKGQTGHVIRHFKPAYRAPEWRGLKNLKTLPLLCVCVYLLPFSSPSPLCPLSHSLSLSLWTQNAICCPSVSSAGPGSARRWKLHSHTLSPRDVFAIQYFHTQAASSLLWNRTLGRMRMGASGTERLRGGEVEGRRRRGQHRGILVSGGDRPAPANGPSWNVLAKTPQTPTHTRKCAHTHTLMSSHTHTHSTLLIASQLIWLQVNEEEALISFIKISGLIQSHYRARKNTFFPLPHLHQATSF